MSYCTIDQLINLFGREEITALSNLHDPAAQEIDADRVEAALGSAEAEANTYLQQRYPLPLPSVPVVLTNKVADIARYQLDSVSPRDDVRRRYEDAVRWLMAIAKGQVSLGLDATQQTTAPSAAIEFITAPKTFSPQNLQGF